MITTGMAKPTGFADAWPGAIVAFLLMVLASPEPVAAQASILGRVVDSETGQALPGAKVVIRGVSAPLTTDSVGRFEARALRAGETQVRIEQLGYAAGDFRVRLPEAGAVERVFSLDFTGDRLPEVAVRARIEQLMPRYLDFERRRHRGLGAFFRWDELRKESYGSVGDALRTVRGVRMQCNQQTFECFAIMTRTPNCRPVWYLDGMEAGSFNENTPIRDIYGMEIYRGQGEVPGEFSGSNAACGVIVIWTKSKPFR